MDSRLKQSGCLTASLAACFNFFFKSDFPAVAGIGLGGERGDERGRRERDRVPDFDSDT